jgi:hypothetical protein
LVRQFLKHNGFNLFLAILALFAIRLWAYHIGIPEIEPAITWRLVAERLASGEHLYKTVWTSLEPFAAGTYYLLELTIGCSTKVSFVLSLLLVLIQAYLFSTILHQHKLFNQSTALSTLLYILFSSLYFDFYFLSPVLLGTTFILFAFSIICVQARIMKGEDHFFYIGLLIGIASLFYFPFMLFLLFAIVSLGLYSISSLKKQLILTVAFFFPYILVFIYYFWTDNLANYYQYGFIPHFSVFKRMLIDLPTVIKIMVLPDFLLLAAGFFIITRGKFIHYQYKIIKIAGLWIVVALLSFGLLTQIAPHAFFVFVPPLTILVTHLFLLLSKRVILSESLFIATFGGMLIISFYALHKPDAYTKQNLIVRQPSVAAGYGITNKKILVLGDDKNYYVTNSIAGPYVEWPLSYFPFNDLGRYDNVSALYEAFETNQPDFIVDLENRIPAIVLKIPSIQQHYLRQKDTFLYKRINN